MKDIKSSKFLGKMSLEFVQVLLERVESLEQWSNQQNILLDAVLGMLEKNMDVSTDTKSSI